MKKQIIPVLALTALSLSLSGLAMAETTAGSHAMPAKTASKHSAKKMHKAHASMRVKAVQEALNKHGSKLVADGLWGSKTKGALIAFQKKNSLKPTGRLDKATDMKLGIAK